MTSVFVTFEDDSVDEINEEWIRAIPYVRATLNANLSPDLDLTDISMEAAMDFLNLFTGTTDPEGYSTDSLIEIVSGTPGIAYLMTRPPWFAQYDYDNFSATSGTLTKILVGRLMPRDILDADPNLLSLVAPEYWRKDRAVVWNYTEYFDALPKAFQTYWRVQFDPLFFFPDFDPILGFGYPSRGALQSFGIYSQPTPPDPDQVEIGTEILSIFWHLLPQTRPKIVQLFNRVLPDDQQVDVDSIQPSSIAYRREVVKEKTFNRIHRYLNLEGYLEIFKQAIRQNKGDLLDRILLDPRRRKALLHSEESPTDWLAFTISLKSEDAFTRLLPFIDVDWDRTYPILIDIEELGSYRDFDGEHIHDFEEIVEEAPLLFLAYVQDPPYFGELLRIGGNPRTTMTVDGKEYSLEDAEEFEETMQSEDRFNAEILRQVVGE